MWEGSSLFATRWVFGYRLPPCARLTLSDYRVSCFACALLGARHLLAQLLVPNRGRRGTKQRKTL